MGFGSSHDGLNGVLALICPFDRRVDGVEEEVVDT